MEGKNGNTQKKTKTKVDIEQDHNVIPVKCDYILQPKTTNMYILVFDNN